MIKPKKAARVNRAAFVGKGKKDEKINLGNYLMQPVCHPSILF